MGSRHAEGADALLGALGIGAERRSPVHAWLMSAAFSAAMISMALVTSLLEERVLGGSERAGVVGSALLTTLVWALWTHWHSVLFVERRARYLRTSVNPYRTAFVRDIFPGVSVGFSQMLRPLFNGGVLAARARGAELFTDGLALAALGALFVTAGSLVFLNAMRTLGVARAGFVPEFAPAGAFKPERGGIYGRVRHPLFWSGVVLSVGLALLTQRPAAYAIAGVNVIYGFIYNELEDRRLGLVFGKHYSDYARQVPRCIPELRRSVALRRAPRR